MERSAPRAWRTFRVLYIAMALMLPLPLASAQAATQEPVEGPAETLQPPDQGGYDGSDGVALYVPPASHVPLRGNSPTAGRTSDLERLGRLEPGQATVPQPVEVVGPLPSGVRSSGPYFYCTLYGPAGNRPTVARGPSGRSFIQGYSATGCSHVLDYIFSEHCIQRYRGSHVWENLGCTGRIEEYQSSFVDYYYYVPCVMGTWSYRLKIGGGGFDSGGGTSGATHSAVTRTTC